MGWSESYITMNAKQLYNQRRTIIQYNQSYCMFEARNSNQLQAKVTMFPL